MSWTDSGVNLRAGQSFAVHATASEPRTSSERVATG